MLLKKYKNAKQTITYLDILNNMGVYLMDEQNYKGAKKYSAKPSLKPRNINRFQNRLFTWATLSFVMYNLAILKR